MILQVMLPVFCAIVPIVKSTYAASKNVAFLMIIVIIFLFDNSDARIANIHHHMIWYVSNYFKYVMSSFYAPGK